MERAHQSIFQSLRNLAFYPIVRWQARMIQIWVYIPCPACMQSGSQCSRYFVSQVLRSRSWSSSAQRMAAARLWPHTVFLCWVLFLQAVSFTYANASARLCYRRPTTTGRLIRVCTMPVYKWYANGVRIWTYNNRSHVSVSNPSRRAACANCGKISDELRYLWKW